MRDLGLGTERRPIEAVLVMNDPDDWYRDLQLIVDVLLSGGVPERRGEPPAGVCGGMAADGVVRGLSTYPDLLPIVGVLLSAMDRQ